MKPLTFGSLFAGIGGFDLGFERAGMTCKWQVEIDPFCQKVLAKHWPKIPRHTDIKTFPTKGGDWRVDVLCGGFPCQDISYAGKGAGLEGARSGLWYEFVRVIRKLGPRYVVVENVEALLDRGMGAVLGTLADCGYDAEWSVLSSCTLGATHMRRRVFVVAYADAGWERRRKQFSEECEKEKDACLRGDIPEPARVVDGIPSRLDRSRVKALGNAVDPHVAEVIGRALVRVHKAISHKRRPGKCFQAI